MFSLTERIMKAEMMHKAYIVKEEILPEAIQKTAQAKELLIKGDVLTVHEAVEKVGMSRSAFYKYRDGVQPYQSEDQERVIAVTLVLEHRLSVLPLVLSVVTGMKGSIDSISQSMPVRGVVVVTMNINMVLANDEDLLAESLRSQDGVIKVEIIS